MRLPPAVIVHGLAMAEEAVRLAAGQGRRITLLSAPGAAAYAGIGWWQALVRAASPQGDMPDIIDCGEAAGRALEALRLGQKLLILRKEPRIWTDIAGRAYAIGSVLLDHPPEALDLGRRGAFRRLPAWIEKPCG